MKRQELLDYFTRNLEKGPFEGEQIRIGAEVETHFVDGNRRPISIATSQGIFKILEQQGWRVAVMKGNLITELKKGEAKILYELGRQNIELATQTEPPGWLWDETRALLQELYAAAQQCNAYPFFAPIIEADEDLLVVPDERDASWLTLDGRDALSLLARTASVQFTIDTWGPHHAMEILRALAQGRENILKTNPYPQEELWRKYIATSKAGYRADRYGVVMPDSIEQYVELLANHDVVINGKLVPFMEAHQSIDLFLRSVWWNFRLRRYNDRLCIEIRTLARRTDDEGKRDLKAIKELIFPYYSAGYHWVV